MGTVMTIERDAATAVDTVCISVLGAERRAAALAGGRVVGFAIDDPRDAIRAGDIILGRVTGTRPALGAAFVDIGSARPGILMADDSRRPVGEGEAVIVQVRRQPEGGKGARLSTRLRLAGRFLVCRPGQPGIDISRRVADKAERDRLTTVVQAIASEATAGIAPGAAEDIGWTAGHRALAADPAALAADARDLLSAWRGIGHAAGAAGPVPRPLRPADSPVDRLLDRAAEPALARVLIDDADTLLAIRRRFPALADRLHHHRDARPLFDATGVTDDMAEALGRWIDLDGGGRLAITETEALVTIDVDTASADEGAPEATALKVNQAAAAAIGRLVRLLDLAGTLIVDPVPLRRTANRARVVRALKAAFADDGAHVDVAGYTRLGLIEFQREKQAPSLLRRLTTTCPACDGAGRVGDPVVLAHDALRDAVAAGRHAPHLPPRLTVSEDVAAALNGPAQASHAWAEGRLGRPIDIDLSTGRRRGWPSP